MKNISFQLHTESTAFNKNNVKINMNKFISILIIFNILQCRKTDSCFLNPISANVLNFGNINFIMLKICTAK